MGITKCSIDRSIVSFGDEITASVTFKNTEAWTAVKLSWGICFAEKDIAGEYWDDYYSSAYPMAWIVSDSTVSIAKGATKTLTATFTIPDGTGHATFKERFEYYRNEYNQSNVRAVPLRLIVSLDSKNDETNSYESEPTSTILLDAHYDLSIQEFSMVRATNGRENDEGEEVLSMLKMSVSDEADLSRTTLSLYYEQNSIANTESNYINLTDRIPDALNGIVNSTDLIPTSLSKDSDWNFLLIFDDGYEPVQTRFNLAEAFANVHLSGSSTGGVAFGKFSSATEDNPLFECQYPAEFNAPATFNAGIQGITNFPMMDDTSTYPPNQEKSSDYSKEERTGGTWIDGRPIYRYTWMGISNRSGSQGSYGKIPDGNPDTVIRLYGTFKRPSDNAWFAMPNVYYGNLSYAVNMRTNSDGSLTVGFGSSYDGTKNMILVVEYVKAKDKKG